MMGYTDTLVVKNVPSPLSNEDIKKFFKYFGASNTVVHNSKHKKRSTVFAKFESGEIANAVLLRLHQKELLGYRLAVEFADSKNSQAYEGSDIRHNEKKNTNESNYYEEFLQQLNSWTRGLNFKLPPPCHLKYRYPAPTSEVLYNISNMLTSIPKLYTQVLHLMNKMNLPCPFEPDYPIEDNKVFDSYLSYIYDKCVQKLQLDESSSEVESELDSDNGKEGKKDIVVLKRKKVFKKNPIKRPKIKQSTMLTTTSKLAMHIEDVFEKVNQDISSQKKIEMKVPETISVEQHNSNEIENTGFGVLYPIDKQKEQHEIKDEECDNEHCISSEKLAVNRIPDKDKHMLPIFKNYQAGNPSCRLYIKNLSRRVTREDLLFIYNKYFIKGIDEQGTMFDIRLMQEGRMKGQAFVTLQNVKQAQLALQETNGYILKDKPMVVQFARSAVAK